MQHIPVVSHVLCGGTFNLEITVPATPTRGSYHRRDDVVFIYSGERSLSGLGGSAGGVRRGRELLRFPIDCSGWDGDWGGLFSGISSLMGTAVLGSVDPCMGQCIRESSKSGWANSGSSVHSVGRAVLVLTLAHPSCCDGATSACMPLAAPPSGSHPPQGSACKLPFLMRIRPGGRTDSNTETSYLIQTANLRH